MELRSTLFLPPGQLSGCLFAAIHRDTRGIELCDRDRLNFFPASPLVAVTHIAEGELRLLPQDGGLDAARVAPALPRLTIVPSRDAPTVSWSPGPLVATTIGFYPDAWTALSDACDAPQLLLQAFGGALDAQSGWKHFCGALGPVWQTVRGSDHWKGPSRLHDWSQALIVKAALAGPGSSVRALQRRLKRWSGQTQRTLEFYASFDRLHGLALQNRSASLADLALEAGYSDQSHMGRAVRRATGFSPAALNRRIETEEAFWCYRLLGERF